VAAHCLNERTLDLQSAARQTLTVDCRYFAPRPQSLSEPYCITMLWPVLNYLA